MRITPARGLSMSAMRKRKWSTVALPCIPKPSSKLERATIRNISIHTAIGMRFHHTACVYPYAFKTSSIPDAAGSIGPAGDDMGVGRVGLNAGCTQKHFECGERAIRAPGTLENRRYRLRAQECFPRSLG